MLGGNQILCAVVNVTHLWKSERLGVTVLWGTGGVWGQTTGVSRKQTL